MANRTLNLSFTFKAFIVFFIALFYYLNLSPFHKIDIFLYKSYQKLIPSSKATTNKVALIEIDQRSLDDFGSWPLPHQHLAGLIDRLQEAGAKQIALLLPLSYVTPTASYRLEVRKLMDELDAHPLSSQHKKLTNWVMENLIRLEKSLDQGKNLSESVKNHGKVFLPVYALKPGGAQRPADKEALSVLASSLLGPSELTADLKEKITVPEVKLPFDGLSQAASGFGHLLATSEGQSVPGMHLPFLRYGGTLIPSLPFRVAMDEMELEPDDVRINDEHILYKGGEIPLYKGSILLHFYANEKMFKIYRFSDVLKGDTKAGLKGKTVLVALGPGIRETVATPFHSMAPGGRVAAETLEALLAGRFISRPSASPYAETFGILLFGAFAIFFYTRMKSIKSLWVSMGLVLVSLGFGLGAFSFAGMWIKTGSIALCVFVLYLISAFEKIAFSPSTRKEAIETNRLLGLSFQSQGLLDLAFDKFKKLPLDNEARDLLYNLGLEFEQKRMMNKALEAYEYINKGGGYRDLGDRIPRLRESDRSSTLGSHDKAREGSLILDAGNKVRNRVGRYEILGELGKGSMGLVYKAQDPKINRLLAIKTIRFSDEFEDDVIQDIKSRFFTEAEIAGKLSHPSIVTIYDAGEDGDLTYMVMEYLEGENLDKFINKGSLLPISRVLEVVARVADALDFAHQSSVIHRDIKPANIMLLNNGAVKVTDFGIAKAISSSRTRTGVILGTPNYMSPEQIMGQKIDQRSDIFSLGVLFFQLLTGDLPFHGDNLSNLLYQITQVRHPSIREINPKIPKACEQIIDKALAKDPTRRFQRASEMARLVKLLAAKIEEFRRNTAPKQSQPKA